MAGKPGLGRAASVKWHARAPKASSNSPKAAPRVAQRAAPKRPLKDRGGSTKGDVLTSAGLRYETKGGLNAFVTLVSKASPLELVDLERNGVHGILVKDLARHLDINASRMYRIIGVPKATIERKASIDDVIKGSSGQAALGLVRLLGMARRIVGNSTSTDAVGFDTERWLGQWIERPQPALGGKKPADLLDTPTGIDMVARVLGAVESGAYV